MASTVTVSTDFEELVADLSSYILQSVDRLNGKKASTDYITIGLSGGSMPAAVTAAFAACGDRLDWRRLRLVFCDERRVAFDDAESTYGAYRRTLLAQMAGQLSEHNFVVIDHSLPVQQCATDYETKLRQLVPKCDDNNMPRLDILLLGLGPDGHTCSLFPKHPLLLENKLMVAPISDSPKPPPERVTLTLAAVNRARYVAFVTTGAGKATVLQDILENRGCQLPAALVRPEKGELTWLIDRDAARLLTATERVSPKTTRYSWQH